MYTLLRPRFADIYIGVPSWVTIKRCIVHVYEYWPATTE